jgi:hypothetical protein
MVASSGVSTAATQVAAKSEASVFATGIGARPHARHHDVVRRVALPEPHYYARPVYYRRYPYGVPAPFVLGFGPWW